MFYTRTIKILFTMTIAVILTSCATTANYESILNSWIGTHADGLVTSWGSPQNSYPLSSGGHVIEYIRQGSVAISGYTYYVPQTSFHAGSVSAYGRYGSSAYGTYSGTTMTYVPMQTPSFNVHMECKTQFVIDKSGIITKWQWHGNSCKAFPSKQTATVGSTLERKYINLQKVVNDSQYGKKAKELLDELVKEQQIIIEKKEAQIEDLKKVGSNNAIQEETDQYLQAISDSQNYVKSLEKYLNDFVRRHAQNAVREVTAKNNYDINYEMKDNMEDISSIVINELDRMPIQNVEIYFKNIR